MSDKKMDKKMIGFRADSNQQKKLDELTKKFQQHNPIGTITGSDIMRIALDELYKQYFTKR